MKKILAALAFLLAASAARAIEPTAVPDFTVLSTGGEAVESRSLVAEAEARGPAGERWVLLYVPLDWSRWASLLQALERAGPRAAGRFVLLVGGAAPADLARRASRADKSPGVTWLADPDGGALGTLPPSALPIAYGVKGWAFEWATPLGTRTADELASLLGDWVGR